MIIVHWIFLPKLLEWLHHEYLSTRYAGLDTYEDATHVLENKTLQHTATTTTTTKLCTR